MAIGEVATAGDRLLYSNVDEFLGRMFVRELKDVEEPLRFTTTNRGAKTADPHWRA